MQLNSVEFLKSSVDIDECPQANLPEYAFIGRSNVGKSSLINMITGKKAIAKVSSRPGKTQTVNHFLVNKNWYLADLPGYGYAKVSKSSRKEFGSIINNYLKKRPNLVTLFILVDSRHEPMNIDIEFINKMGQAQIPFVILFTKIDKISGSELNKNTMKYRKKLEAYWDTFPKFIHTSATSNVGKEQILDYMMRLNKDLFDVIKENYNKSIKK